MGKVLEDCIAWVDRPVDVCVENGIVIGRVHSGGQTWEYRCTPAILVATIGNMACAYAGFLANKGARVFPMAEYARLRPIKVQGEEI
jgi:hypothetical protein